MLAVPLVGQMMCAGGLAATRLVLRRPAWQGVLGSGMKGVDPTDARLFAEACLHSGALGSFMVEQRALVWEFPAVLGGLSEVRVPTTVVSGGRDRLIAPGSARRLAEGIAGAELRIVPGAGHFLPGISPGVLAEVVLAAVDRAGL
jgi:pimeloyl-ACP methyl ester carboxylesterase